MSLLFIQTWLVVPVGRNTKGLSYVSILLNILNTKVLRRLWNIIFPWSRLWTIYSVTFHISGPSRGKESRIILVFAGIWWLFRSIALLRTQGSAETTFPGCLKCCSQRKIGWVRTIFYVHIQGSHCLLLQHWNTCFFYLSTFVYSPEQENAIRRSVKWAAVHRRYSHPTLLFPTK